MALLALVAQTGIFLALLWVGTRLWLNLKHARHSGLRAETEAQMRIATTVEYARDNRVATFGRNGSRVGLPGGTKADAADRRH